MAPNLIVYTVVNRDLKFDPAVDKREVLLTGFNGHNHDHGLHSLTVGPDGLWYWSMGNCGGGRRRRRHCIGGRDAHQRGGDFAHAVESARHGARRDAH
jgi:hypothetical protein